MDESWGVVTAAEAGLGKDFLPMVEMLSRGELTDCGRRTLMQSDVVITKDPVPSCADCPLAMEYSGRGGLTVRSEYEAKAYGLLSASILADLTTDKGVQ